MAFWTGRVGACYWSHHQGAHDSASWSAFLADVKGFLTFSEGSVSMITFAQQASPINAAQRQGLAELAKLEIARKLTFHAFVAHSRAVQLTLTALDWLVRKHYQEKAFVEPTQALEWLTANVPDLDPRAIVESLAQGVPGRYLPDAFQPHRRRA